jgi:hypothetical protein
MGAGRDMARAADQAAPHHDVLENFRDQLIVAFLKRLADKDGVFNISVTEVDATGDSIVSFAVHRSPTGQMFQFKVSKKQ